MRSIPGRQLVALNTNNSNSVAFDDASFGAKSTPAPLAIDFRLDLASMVLSSFESKWNPLELTAPFAEGRWNPMAPSTTIDRDVIDRISEFTPFKREKSLVRRDDSKLTRVELTSKSLPMNSLNLVISSEKKNVCGTYDNFSEEVLSLVWPIVKEPSQPVALKSSITETAKALVAAEEVRFEESDVVREDDDFNFWGEVEEQDDAYQSRKLAAFVEPPVEVDCLPKALIMSFAEELKEIEEEDDGGFFLEDLTYNNGAVMCNINNNSSDVIMSNMNNNGEADPAARFQSMSTMRVGSNNMYQPSAISSSVERQGPFERFQYQQSATCRVGGQGPPGVPAAGGGHSSRPATREGVPWGGKKERKKPLQAINIEPYQKLKPSGNWMHGTKQRQPANKQAQATRAMAYPFYLPEDQKCKARPEYRSSKAETGLTGSTTSVKLGKEKNVDLTKVRCNCPGLYPEHSSHGPGNFWDEEDDDEAILAGMCPDDIEEECGQGQDGVFPLEEWADEWEDGVTSGDCVKGGRLAPGTLDLYPWENPCLEELQKRKRRIQELRNKRWAVISKAKDHAEKMRQDNSATQEQKKKATRQAEKVYNDYSQKSWSLLGWFNPENWASGGGSGCGGAEDKKREGKTTTVRSNSGSPAEKRGSTPAIKLGLKDSAACPSNTCRNNSISSNRCGDNSSNNANCNKNNCVASVEEIECASKTKGKRKCARIDDYEWESADDSALYYNQELAASGFKSRNDAKERIFRMEEEQRRRKKHKKQQDANRLREAANGAGILANIWGYFTGAKTSPEEETKEGKPALVDANISANNATISAIEDANVNNNAANRCLRPCPPCPQGDCEPPPFECPCNDVSCPKKLKPKNNNLDINDIQSESSTVNFKRGDNNAIVDIEIDLKKPRPDLALGCPCGDEACKKKFCNKPDPPRQFDICQLSKGPMNKQQACPDPEETDICDKGQDTQLSRSCPCADEFCPNKPGGDGYFKFLYPPPDKMKYSEEGCPEEQQIECWVLPNGQVKCKPVLSPLHCEVIPPCPCDDWTKKEFDSCDCSGNSWGEEADDEELDEGECGAPPEEENNECGSQQVPGGLGKADEYEWDLEDIPCLDIPEDASIDQAEAAEAQKQCQDYMEYRSKKTSSMQAAMEEALRAWKLDKARKEKEKDQQGARKRKIEAYRAEGLDDDEIYDLMCVVNEAGLCDIVGDYPLQKACQPPPNDPPGCPCPDLKCPKRKMFEDTMFDKDMSKYKTKKEIAAAERYYSSDQYKTMDCELKDPTYKDVGKTYPKARQCPCPDCKEDDQKAWAEVEKMKIGPPPECPCQDIKCPKKPPKTEEEEIEKESSPCHMRGRYPKQSGCLDVIRCDLIKDPCNDPCTPKDQKKPPPKEEFRCHGCSLKTPMPKQSSCPDYDCQQCALVCDDCGCRPTKCEKCEADKPEVVPEQNLCAPCTVPRPFPKQSSCKELHPCDQAHPCMCDPSTGEAIDAERCGPCDTRNHSTYPDQSGCPKELPPEPEICDAEAQMKGKNLKAMKLFDTRTGFSLLENQAAITCETDESGKCKQGECNPGFSEVTINLTDATKARLMPGNPASAGIIEGRGGEIIADPKKKKELDEKRKNVEEAQVKCVRVIDYEASSNDDGIIDTDDKKIKEQKKNVKGLKNFKKSMSTLKLTDDSEDATEKAGESIIENGKDISKTVVGRAKDINNNADSAVVEVMAVEELARSWTSKDIVDASEPVRLFLKALDNVQESAGQSKEQEASAQRPEASEAPIRQIPAFDEVQPEIVKLSEEPREAAEFLERREDRGNSEAGKMDKDEMEDESTTSLSEGEVTRTQDAERSYFQTNQNRFVEEKPWEEHLGELLEATNGLSKRPSVSPTEEEAEDNCARSCLFTENLPNIIMKKSQYLSVSDFLPNEMKPKMKCKQTRNLDTKSILDIDHGLVIDKPPTIDLSDEEGDYGTKFARSTKPTFFRRLKDDTSTGLNSFASWAAAPSSASPSSEVSVAPLSNLRRSADGVFHRTSTLDVKSSRLATKPSSGWRKTPSQELFLVESDENGAKILGSVNYDDIAAGAKREISDRFSQSAACALEKGDVDETVHYLSRAILSHPEPKGFLERLGVRNFLPTGFWS